MRNELEAKARKTIAIICLISLVIIAGDGIVSALSQGNVYRDSKGIYIVRPEGDYSSSLSLKAKVKSDGREIEKNYDISIKPFSEEIQQEADGTGEKPSDEASEEEMIRSELRGLLAEVNRNTNKKKFYLPSKLSTGEKVIWSKSRRNNSAVLIFLTMVICIAVYTNRFKQIAKDKQRQRDSVMRQLPEFINRLVLLLNAGLVLSTAFNKSIEDGIKYNIHKDDYFYKRMGEIYNSITSMNGVIEHEFRSFAKESGVNEMIRVSNIITDNISKGADLTEKLQCENQVIWENRKSNCEERGRLSETKLTLPLTVFLLVLIFITVSPALLEL